MMIYINHEEYLTRFPKVSCDYENMNDDDRQIFLSRYSLYESFLYDYLINKTSIKDFDDKLKKHPNYTYQAVSDSKKDIYQFMATGKLSYYYVRNNLNINNLNEEELKFLDNRMNNNAYDKDVEAFIENTLKKVLCESTEMTELICYGPQPTSYFLRPNGTLIIGQRFNEYVANDLSKKDIQEQYIIRQALATNQSKKLEETLSTELDVPVAVLEYSGATVKSRHTYEEIHKI